MQSLIYNSLVSELKGTVGSNPEIVKIYPEEDQSFQNLSKDEILSVCFPEGAISGEFHLQKINKLDVLIYTFSIDNENGRNHIGSIGFTISKEVIVEDFKNIIILIFDYLKMNLILSFEVLLSSLESISNGINNLSEIEFTPIHVFNIKNALVEQQMNLKKPTNLKRGRIV